MTTFSSLMQQNYRENPSRVSVYLQHAGEPDLLISYCDLVKGAHSNLQRYARADIQPGEVVVLIL
jgi:hypothetical protein